MFMNYNNVNCLEEMLIPLWENTTPEELLHNIEIINTLMGMKITHNLIIYAYGSLTDEGLGLWGWRINTYDSYDDNKFFDDFDFLIADIFNKIDEQK